MAFYMAEDNHRSLTEDIRLARGKRPASPDFDAFAEQYASLPILSTFLSTKTAPALHKILLGLDPRISELVHQVQKFGEEPSLVTSGSASLDMYLPFLLDDPTRTLEDLSRLVRELPNLADLLDTEHADEGTGMAESIAAAIFQSLGITESNEHAVAESKKKRKKKGEHTNERQPPDSAWRTNNMFGSLS
ncbi:hypothetical protein MBLNU459_g7896t1 [Dothideomycetes sp. NU459]